MLVRPGPRRVGPLALAHSRPFFLSQTLSTVTRMRESFEWRGEGGVRILVHRRLSHLKG